MLDSISFEGYMFYNHFNSKTRINILFLCRYFCEPDDDATLRGTFDICGGELH